MIKKLFIIAIVLIFTITAIALHAEVRTVNGTVSKVIDGDTLHIKTPEQTKLKVRLYGIDAQESYNKNNQPYGEKAKEALRDKVIEKQVRLDIITTDKYRRIVGIIWLENRNINLEMIKEGYAEAFSEYLQEPYRSKFIEAEKEAKAAKKGIWSLTEYERPIDFRKRLKVR